MKPTTASDPTQQGSPRHSRPHEGSPPRVPSRTWLTFVALLAVNYALMRLLFPGAATAVTVPYTVFKEQVAEGNVVSIYSKGANIEGRLREAVTWPTPGQEAGDTQSKPRTSTTFNTTLPAFVDPQLEQFLIANKVEISARPIQSSNALSMILFGFGPALLLIGFYVWMYRRAAQGGMGGLMGIGKSKARRYDESNHTRVTFNDVAGIDEAEGELVEIVSFLKAPQKYTRLGAMALR